jgi:hypothetical protein
MNAYFISAHLLESINVYDGEIKSLQLCLQSCMSIFEIDRCPLLEIWDHALALGVDVGVWASRERMSQSQDRPSDRYTHVLYGASVLLNCPEKVSCYFGLERNVDTYPVSLNRDAFLILALEWISEESDCEVQR